jgi:hypothetical protein
MRFAARRRRRTIFYSLRLSSGACNTTAKLSTSLRRDASEGNFFKCCDIVVIWITPGFSCNIYLKFNTSISHIVSDSMRENLLVEQTKLAVTAVRKGNVFARGKKYCRKLLRLCSTLQSELFFLAEK